MSTTAESMDDNVTVVIPPAASITSGAQAATLALSSAEAEEDTSLPSNTACLPATSASASTSSSASTAHEHPGSTHMSSKQSGRASKEEERDDSQARAELEGPKSHAIVMEDPDLAHLSEQQRKIVLEHVAIPQPKTVSFLQLFRFSTRFELVLNSIGLLAAIVAGAAQPLMTVVFGSLTTSFVGYQSALLTNDESLISAATASVYTAVNQDVLYLVYIGIAMFAATFIYTATWIYSGEATTRRIREAYLRSALRQNVAYFDAIGAGEVTTRISSDTHLIQEGISDKLPITVMFVSIFITGFIVAFVRNARLAGAVSCVIPLIAITGALMNKVTSRHRAEMLRLSAEGGTLAEEVISSVRNTHAFGTQSRLAAMYDIKNVQTLQLGKLSAKTHSIGMGFLFFIIYGAYGLAFYYGTTLILQNSNDSAQIAGEIINVLLAILIGAFSLAQIAPNMQAFAFAQGAATAIFATIDRIPIIDSASLTGLQPPSIDGSISFDNVDFLYPSRPSVQVLSNFSATFPSVGNTALGGASGSGKSTIIALIERFYDPVGGSIRLGVEGTGGVEVKELNVKWLRNQIGLVSQEPVLFATTVAGNIEHGLIGSVFLDDSPQRRRERVVDAAVQANADIFIRALPQGYDTLIGERGLLLSGGQKQRIAIARAIISDPPILLLDEATSALDTTSEAIVQAALDSISKSTSRTTITVSHRLSTIKDADQIIVMSAGRILESAMSSSTVSAHHDLLSNPTGAYSKLVEAQRFREEGEDDVEKAEEISKEDKPAFEDLARMATGRSIASDILRAKHDEEMRGKHQHSLLFLLRAMLAMNKQSKWSYVAGVLSSIVVGCVYPIFGIVFGGVIGVFSETGDALRAGGDRFALYAFLLSIVASASVMVQNYVFGSSAEELSRILRLSVFSAILRQDIAFFDKEENSTGTLTSAISDWAQRVNGLMGITSGVIIQSIFTLIAGSIIGLAYSWKIALVGIACFPLTIVAGVARLQVVVLKDAKNKKAHEQSAQQACEAAGAIRTVASLNREDDCCNIYSQSLELPQQISNRTAIFSNAYFSVSQSLSFFVIGLIFWFGSRQLVAREVTSTGFFVTMISIVFASIQVGNVFNFVPDMSKARGAAGDVVDLLASEPDIDVEDTDGIKMSNLEGCIRFEGVHFRYPTRPHVRVLRGLDMEIKAGQFVAIVGPSGCGKSTLIQLIERFYDPLSGKVTVDGSDISSLNIASHRQQLSLVSQEPTLYAGTVRFNITLGAIKPVDQVSQEEIEQACKDANIHNFVVSLPDGYDTEVGGKGSQLSGGQKQRIAIARALIRNPKILLLDEATSALDSESEKLVQTALDKAAAGRTTVAIAHRLSTIQGADMIYVLRDGKVAEAGKHFDLLAKKGIYFELVNQQDLEKRR